MTARASTGDEVRIAVIAPGEERAQLSGALREWAGAVRWCAHAQECLALLESAADQAAPLDVVLIAPAEQRPLARIRQIQARDPIVEVVIVTRSGRAAELEAAVRLTPFAARVLTTSEADAVSGRLAAAVRVSGERARRKRGVQTSLRRLNGIIASAGQDGERERLAVSERYLATLLASAPDAIFALDLDGRVVSWNAAASRIFGLSAGEASGRPLSSLLSDNLADTARALLEQARDGGDVVRRELDCRRADGNVFDGELSLVLVREERGRSLGLSAVLRDVTARKHAEQELQATHALLEAVAESTTDAVYVKDLAGRYLLMNTAGARMLGRSVEEVIGRGDFELFEPATARSLIERDRAVVELGDTLTIEEETTAGTVTRTYSSTKGPCRDRSGQIVGVVGISRDITASKETAAQRLRAQRMEAVGRLAGGIAHDFNNLLTVISGYACVLGARIDDDALRQDVEEIRRAASRAAALTEQLLSFSRQQVIRPAHVDVNRVLAEADRLLRRLVGSHIEFVTHFNASFAWVIGDPTQLEQIVVNLVVNARDAMPDGGRLAIETGTVEITADERLADLEPGSYVLLSVADTGVGMDAETAAHVFEPFYTTKQVGEGTGLGLATTYGIVEHARGHISVESTPGLGSRFTVYLPRAANAPADAPIQPPVPSSLTGWETVLLAEDEDSVRTLIRRTLESHGYTVLEARYADEALAVAAQTDRRIDLLVTDVVMPGISGVELASQLLTSARVGSALLISGYVDAGDARRDLAAGTLPFLQKPFTPDTLARIVRDVLDAAARAT